jgi:putative NADH-flavin reductase
VRALVRDPARLSEPVHDIVTGDAADGQAVRQCLEGVDAVASALGPGTSWKARRTSTIMTDAARTLVPAMEATGVRRFVGISALGVGATWEDLPYLLRPAYRVLLRQPIRDKEEAERLLSASQLDWTLVYPPMLTNGPANGYEAAERLRFRGAAKISREDVAALMLDCAEGKAAGPQLEVKVRRN